MKNILDEFNAYLIDGASFTNNEEYPIIPSDIVAKDPPTKVMPFFKAIAYKGDLSDYYIYFYCKDGTFDRVRKNPKKYVNFFKKCKGIIGFDYSIYTDMPIIMQKAQINDNLSLTYYFGTNGIPVIPNARGGANIVNDEFLEALPKNSLLGLGMHGFVKYTHQKYEWIEWINKIIDKLNPAGFVVIGKIPDVVKEVFDKRINFYQFDSIVDQRNEEIKNANKRC